MNRFFFQILSLTIFIGAFVSGCAEGANPVRDIALSTGLATPAKTPPEFVTKTRPSSLEFMPVGVKAPPRPLAMKTLAEVEASKAALDGSRTKNDANASIAKQLGSTPKPEPAKY